MKLGDIMLTETNQINTVEFHLYEVTKVFKFRQTESRMMVARIWGEDKIEN